MYKHKDKIKLETEIVGEEEGEEKEKVGVDRLGKTNTKFMCRCRQSSYFIHFPRDRELYCFMAWVFFPSLISPSPNRKVINIMTLM